MEVRVEWIGHAGCFLEDDEETEMSAERSGMDDVDDALDSVRTVGAFVGV
jgi:hypothetical protein